MTVGTGFCGQHLLSIPVNILGGVPLRGDLGAPHCQGVAGADSVPSAEWAARLTHGTI